MVQAMIRIIKLFGRLNPGGAEIRTLELITEINKRKVPNLEFHILVLSGEKGSLDETFTEQGVKIHYMRLYRVDFMIKFIKLIRKEKINVLYSNVFLFSGVFMLIGWFLRVPIRISHIRTLFDEKEDYKRRIRNIVLKYLIRRFSTTIIGVNRSVLKRNFGKYLGEDEKYKILPNGISVKEINKNNPFKKDQINIIHIGRQVVAKNHFKLIGTFIKLNEFYPDSVLHLIGHVDDEINRKIQKVVQENNLQERVINWGVQEEIPKFFEGKNLLIFPSTREGLPGVILESLAYGVPVLASNIEPHLELNEYFKNVNIVDLKKSNLEWAKKAKSIIENNLTLNDEKIIEDFKSSPYNLKNHVDNYLRIILNEKPN